MKKGIVWLSTILLGLLLAGCSQSLVEPAATAAEAGAEFAQIVNLAIQGAAAGDDAPLESYLAEGAHGAELNALLEDNGIADLTEEAAAKGLLWFQPLPQFSDPSKYATGDVLLSRSLCSLTSNLLAWLVLSQYTHCGVLNQELFASAGGDPREVPCVLSATLNDEVSGVTYETWNDWKSASTVTVLRPRAGVPVPDALTLGGIRTAFGYDHPAAPTEYAFVVTDPAAGLVPVPGVPSPSLGIEIPTAHAASWGPFAALYGMYGTPQGAALCAHYWYCSKTGWWAYRSLGADIEYNYLIDVIDKVYGIENSGFYHLYRLLFDADDATARAFCYFASDVCVWPDEIRWAGDRLPWLLTRYAPSGHAPPMLLAKQWTWGLPAY